jgi:alkylhydroperoxidase family enzyme
MASSGKTGRASQAKKGPIAMGLQTKSGVGSAIRLPPIRPMDLTQEQRALYEDMRQGIARDFQGFTNMDNGGALLGPWNPWLHDPQFGKAIWELTKTVVAVSTLPAVIREIAILVTGAHFRSRYVQYAHELAAQQRGIANEKLKAILDGQRPAGMTQQEAAAYDFASALVSGGVLPDEIYHAATGQFGDRGVSELSYLVGLYCLISVTLNTFDVPVPEK